MSDIPHHDIAAFAIPEVRKELEDIAAQLNKSYNEDSWVASRISNLEARSVELGQPMRIELDPDSNKSYVRFGR